MLYRKDHLIDWRVLYCYNIYSRKFTDKTTINAHMPHTCYECQLISTSDDIRLN